MKIQCGDVDIITDPDQNQIEFFHQGLRSYNSQFLKEDWTPFAAVSRNAKGEIIAGINGQSYWGRLHIENLWVHESYRKKGLGKELIELAEKTSKEQGCSGIDLDTMSFQAPGFYEKMGFNKVGEIANYKQGIKRFYYSKEF
ncbi:MAG: GNAT family N-acetyltransferase [Deltaproteobacteria bacterium]|nr:GNAT family N-acetyltransferase [Deltaproteobacteria bacterium]